MGAERVVDGKELWKEVCETRKKPEELERELAAWRSVLLLRGQQHLHLHPSRSLGLSSRLDILRTRAFASPDSHYCHMPRISPRAFRIARTLHPNLAKLLLVCRDLRSAHNELRWIHECVQNIPAPDGKTSLLSRLVRRRARGEPLQYLLGTEYFGTLELKCRPGVLIPRSETAASVTHLVDLLVARLKRQSPPSQLRVLDFCTGTGCIPLLLHDEFYKDRSSLDVSLDLKGYDISEEALNLACDNKALQVARHKKQPSFDTEQLCNRSEGLEKMQFLHFDVLNFDPERGEETHHRDHEQDQRSSKTLSKALGFGDEESNMGCDIFISNPPYISPSDYKRTTARSVREFEPKLALVPPPCHDKDFDGRLEENGDLFYPRLLNLGERLSAKLVLLEVRDMEQAKRVASIVLRRSHWNVGVEIWRDEPSRGRVEEVIVDNQAVRVLGDGNGRSVFIWRKDYDDLGS